MRLLLTLIAAPLVLTATPASSGATETREEYLNRLREICAVDCMQPRQFQRTARKARKSEPQEMALIMDVAFVRRAKDVFELHNIDPQLSLLAEREILGSAGIDTSQRTGVGGLPRGQNGAVTPDVIIVELDETAFTDFLNPIEYEPESQTARTQRRDADGKIIVDREKQKRQTKKATLADLKSRFLNRRIVVRGTPRLAVAWKGGRRDFKNKQVTLEVKDVDDLVMLPRYDDKGDLIAVDLPWVQAKAAQAND